MPRGIAEAGARAGPIFGARLLEGFDVTVENIE
jgi:hypothetical protein